MAVDEWIVSSHQTWIGEQHQPNEATRGCRTRCGYHRATTLEYQIAVAPHPSADVEGRFVGDSRGVELFAREVWRRHPARVAIPTNFIGYFLNVSFTLSPASLKLDFASSSCPRSRCSCYR